MRTRRQLIDAIMDSLGVLVPGQAPSDEDVARIDDHIDPGLATLAALGIIYVADAGTPDPPDGGQIEDAIYLPLADWFAWQLAPAFNLGDSAPLKAGADDAEKVLRTIGRPASTRRTLATDTQLASPRRVPFNFQRGT